jgi:hypothetical protein
MVLLNYGNFFLEINVSLEPEDMFVVAVFGFVEVAKTHGVKEKFFASTSPMANCLLLVVMVKKECSYVHFSKINNSISHGAHRA